MGTIIIPTIPSGVTDADAVNDAFYSTNAVSAKTLNGSLTEANTSTTLTTEHIRDQTLANGKMVGNTGNLDYASGAFVSDEAAPGAYIAIPGASQSFYLPYSPSLVVFSWQIAVTNSQRGVSADREIIVTLDGTPIASQRRTMAPCRLGTDAVTGARDVNSDFFWAGHAVRSNVSKGYHTVSTELFSGSDFMRVRVRNMKVIWFK
tara:strand:+ start:551 stop:1165 length:615 start_codon:yes stop_codon:yes gene_type:complete